MEYNEFVRCYEKLLWDEAKLKLYALAKLPSSDIAVDRHSYRTVADLIREFIANIDGEM